MQNANSSKKNNTLGYLFFGVFVLAGFFAFKTLSLGPLTNFIQARNWVKIPCIVEKSEILSQRGKKNDTYQINIQYRYEYQNTSYTGNNYNFIPFYSSGYTGKNKIISNYPVGKKFFCYVDPTHPHQSVINRSFDWYLLLTLIPLLIFLIGIGGIYSLYKNDNPSRASLQSSSSNMITLEDPAGPIKSFLVVFLSCVFWNGCLILMYNVWWLEEYEKQGGIPIGMTLFSLFFVIPGLLLIYATIYSFLSIFNPTIIMRIKSDKLSLGKQYNLHYKIQGNAQRLSDISFILRGKEEAIKSGGKNRQTFEHVFCENTFFHQGRNMSSSGEVTLEIPLNIMPSFSAPHNKISWTIVARGSISFWPDMNHEFPVTIYPDNIGEA